MCPVEQDELIRRAREGDLDCFNQLVELYQTVVYSVSLRMLGNAAAAEDATQEAFISAFRGMARFRGGSFRAWLLCITSNACRDQLRSLRRRPTTPLEDVAFQLEDGQSSPERHAARRELGAAIRQALAAIPPDQRLAVILRDIEGLEYEEIARATGASLGTVKSRINRGRTRLRGLLQAQRELLP